MQRQQALHILFTPLVLGYPLAPVTRSDFLHTHRGYSVLARKGERQMRLIFIELLLALVLLPLSGLFWWWAFGLGGWALAGFLVLVGIALLLVLRGVRSTKDQLGQPGDTEEQ